MTTRICSSPTCYRYLETEKQYPCGKGSGDGLKSNRKVCRGGDKDGRGMRDGIKMEGNEGCDKEGRE